MLKPLIAGNWKMYMTASQAEKLTRDFKDKLGEDKGVVDIVLCPPFTSLAIVNRLIQGTPIDLGAQNIYWEEEGAFTGEISPAMLKESGCKYVIIGHSERRQFFGETNSTVNKKVKSALKFKLLPIVCVGERLEEREAGNAFKVVETQLGEGLAGLEEKELLFLTIAYEPVWAIGTGKTATPEQANEMHAYIRKLLVEIGGKETAAKIRILYGGSVKLENVTELMDKPEINGALVGGASLKADSFAALVRQAGT